MGQENCCTVPEAEKHGFNLQSDTFNQPQAANHNKTLSASGKFPNAQVKAGNMGIISRNSSKTSFQDDKALSMVNSKQEMRFEERDLMRNNTTVTNSFGSNAKHFKTNSKGNYDS